MSQTPRILELNEPTASQSIDEEMRQHLISASNELFLYVMLCERHGREVPSAIQRAHASVRAELKRMEAASDRHQP
ncbi:MAG: hypothetical protein ACK47B_16725 [Armatimonadota bacterium]